MSGHSQFKNIMHRKGAQDVKKAKIFNKIAREITVAVKSGAADPNANPRLRSAIAAGRAQNMPKERIERAIKSGLPGSADASNYEEVRYEGYGPGGVAIIVEALTDNRNRTASEVRAAFTKHGGTLGETNSVSFVFARQGQIIIAKEKASADKVFEIALDAGAENVETIGDFHEITTSVNDFSHVRDKVEEKLGTPESSGLVWKPLTKTIISDADKAETLSELIEALEDDDDVQAVFTNHELTKEVVET